MPSICKTCDKVVPNKKALEHHRKCHPPEKFTCAECGKIYGQRKNLNQHFKSKHSNEFLQCALCPFKSGRKYILQRHMESMHLPKSTLKKKKKKRNKTKVDSGQKSEKKNLPPVRKFECTMCEKKFTKKSNLTRHVTFHHGNNIGEHLLECAHCSKGFRDKNNLRKHVHLCETRLQQVQSSAKVQLYTCLISGCETVLNNQYAMLQHYKKVHDVVLQYESLEFDSKQKFDEWRAELQRTSACQFSVSKVWKNSSSLNWRMQCHRTGKQPAELENRQRFHKSSGSKKLNGFCPAEIFLKESKKDKIFHATIQKTHVGHCNDSHEELKFLSHMKEKSDTPSKLSKGMPLNTSFLNNQTATQQTEIINYDDIASIATVLGLNTNHPSSYTDNAQNVSGFLDEHQQSILFYKAENSDDTEFGVLQYSDFALVFMSQFQRNLLKKYGDNVIIYNATPKTNLNDFSLHSIMVLDDDCESVAVAFLLSNRNDGTVLELFLHSIKNHVGILTPLTVITDVQTSFHQAFEVAMQAPPYSLWHMWHVFELWRKCLRRIKCSEKRKHVQVILYELSQMTDELIFQTELDIFINDPDPDPDLQSFVEYFKAKWFMNARYWAYCYRIAAKINTNMINEPFHNFLKGKNCGRKKIRTVYQCLQCIEMYISIREHSDVMKTMRPQTLRTRKVRALHTKHHTAVRSEDLYTIYSFPDVGDGCRHTWLISSFEKEEKKRKKKIAKENDNNSEWSSDEELPDESISDNGEECTKEENRLQLYVVQRHIDFIKQEVLSIECSICKVALEEYSCTCTDYLIKGNLCKHIHAVVMYCKKNGYQCTCGSQYRPKIEDIHNIEIKPEIEDIHIEIEPKIEDIDNIEIDIDIDLDDDDDDDDEGLNYDNHIGYSHDQEDDDAQEDSIEDLQSQVMKKIADIDDEETLKNVLQYISLKNRPAPLEEKNENKDDVSWCYTYLDSNTRRTLEE